MSDGTHNDCTASTNGNTPVITMADLPSPNTRRWVARRKAMVVTAVRSGLISLEEACLRYTLSVEEYLSWERAIERHGLPGLRVTRLQDYRAEPGAPEYQSD